MEAPKSAKSRGAFMSLNAELYVANNMEPGDTIIKLTVTNCAGVTEVLNVHRGVLCKSSGFFQSALKPEWTKLDEKTDTMDLSDDSATTVSDYIRWLYSDNLPIKLYKAGEERREKNAEEAEKVFVLLAKSYVFGEKMVDIKYKNAVVKAVLANKKTSNWSMGPESVGIIYKGTPSRCSLRRLIADGIAHQAHDDSAKGVGWMQFFDGFPREALTDAIKAMVQVRTTVNRVTTLDESYLEKE